MISPPWRRVLWLALALGWMGFLFYLSSQVATPIGAVEKGTPGSLALRKLGHAAAFGILALLLLWGLGSRRSGFRLYGAAFAATVAYAVGDEIHQVFTLERRGTVLDVLIDTAGALASLSVWRALGTVVFPRLFRRGHLGTGDAPSS